MTAPPSAIASGTKLRGWIDPRHTALFVIDTQVDFASPVGAVARSGADLRAIPAALAAASRLAAAARRAGATVVFVRLETRPETDSPAWAERMRRRGGVPEIDAALCRAGTSGADFYGTAPAEGDLTVVKGRYSAFFDTSLDAILKARGVDTLVVCGLTTDCCVDCTVRDAFHLDYHVFLAADACAGYDEPLHDAALASLGHNFAILLSAAAVATAWAARGEMAVELDEGMQR
jgi:ureidoacrylate peracid hydrolase